jgi:Probable molybdopterin binding domain
VRLERLVPGRPSSSDLVGAVLPRDLRVDGERWSKGRRLTADDLARLAAERSVPLTGAGAERPLVLLVPEPGDIHEDEAALRLAAAVAGAGLDLRGPAESRVDLLASVAGVVRIRVSALERLDRIDPLEVFTIYDGQIVRPGDLVASVKVAPQLVAEAVIRRGEAVARAGGPVVSVAGFRPGRVGVLVKESVHGPARERFEASVRAKVEGLGSTIVEIAYVADDAAAVADALRSLRRGGATLILTAGARSMDPSDAVFTALAELGGKVVRHGVPAHPGSMLWLARLGRVPILGLPTCGAYSKATAADLLLPRLLAGEPASRATIARLGHGGILTRAMRFRFPAYARELDAPEG